MSQGMHEAVAASDAGCLLVTLLSSGDFMWIMDKHVHALLPVSTPQVPYSHSLHSTAIDTLCLCTIKACIHSALQHAGLLSCSKAHASQV